MRKTLYILVIIGVFGCKHSQKRETISIDSRRLIVYDFDTIITNDIYSLTTKYRDSTIFYEYLNLTDSTKNMTFRFIRNTNKIHFGPTEFELKSRNILKTDMRFDRYEDEPVPDGMGSLYFNENYGILGFYNGQGMQFHFITDKNIEKFDLPIFYKTESLKE